MVEPVYTDGVVTEPLQKELTGLTKTELPSDPRETIQKDKVE